MIAILNAGMYAEAKRNQFNSMPRPATVLVNGKDHCLIRRREQLMTYFQRWLHQNGYKQILTYKNIEG